MRIKGDRLRKQCCKNSVTLTCGLLNVFLSVKGRSYLYQIDSYGKIMD